MYDIESISFKYRKLMQYIGATDQFIFIRKGGKNGMYIFKVKEIHVQYRYLLYIIIK